jgi:hypothetical protein
VVVHTVIPLYRSKGRTLRSPLKRSRKFSLATGFWLFAWSAIASSQDTWTEIGVSEGDRRVYSVKDGSFSVSQTRGDVPIAVVVGRISDPQANKISFYKWYVPLSACADRLGVVVSLDMSGDYLFENDFVYGGGSMAAAMGETICNVYAHYQRTRLNKGM